LTLSEAVKESRKEHDDLIQDMHEKAKELAMFSQKTGRETMNEAIYVNLINELIEFKVALERGE